MFFLIPLKYIVGFLLVLLLLYLLLRLAQILIHLIWPYVKRLCVFLWRCVKAVFASIYASRWLAVILSPLIVVTSVWLTRYFFPLKSFCASWQEIAVMASAPLFIAVTTFCFVPRERDSIAMWPLLTSTFPCYIGLLFFCRDSMDFDAVLFIIVFMIAGGLAFLSRGDKVSRSFFWWGGCVDLVLGFAGFSFVGYWW